MSLTHTPTGRVAATGPMSDAEHRTRTDLAAALVVPGFIKSYRPARWKLSRLRPKPIRGEKPACEHRETQQAQCKIANHHTLDDEPVRSRSRASLG